MYSIVPQHPTRETPLSFLIALLVISAVFSAKLGARYGLPGLLLFLGLGLLVGSDVLGLIYFDDALLAKRIADLALVFVLFESGFHTKRSAFKAAAGPALSLATLGIAITAGVLGLLIHLVLRLDLLFSLLIGSIISSTDAAAVIAILRQRSIRSRVSTTLELESAANDPMAILLTVLIAEALGGEGGRFGGFALKLLWQFGGGLAVGRLLGWLGAFLFDRLESENRGYYYVLSLGLALLGYGGADLLGANGIIAVFFGGYWLGNSEFAYKRGVSHFIEGVSSVGNMAIFLLLGLLAFPRNFAGIWKEGLLIAAFLILVARPLAVLLSTLPFRFQFRERLFLMWGGIKGAVPIVLATYPGAYGLDPEGLVFNIVFFAVLLSCLVQGPSLDWVAGKLGLVEASRPRTPYSLEILTTRKSELDMYELRLESLAENEGRPIRELALPPEALISSIVREEKIIAPRGGTALRRGDILFVLAPAGKIEEIARELDR